MNFITFKLIFDGLYHSKHIYKNFISFDGVIVFIALLQIIMYLVQATKSLKFDNLKSLNYAVTPNSMQKQNLFLLFRDECDVRIESGTTLFISSTHDTQIQSL